MAHRKRASMREGPLADLFRATVDPKDPPEAPERGQRPAEQETNVMREEPSSPPEPRGSEPPPSASEPAPFDHQEGPDEPRADEPEDVRAYRGEPPAAKERLSRIF